MKITVFTSNQPRHVALIEALADFGATVHAIQECTSVFPGAIADFFAKSPVMQRYFSRVIAAERAVFGPPRFPRPTRGAIRQLSLKMGDLSLLTPADLSDALNADLFIVFGSSYIRGPLCEALVERRAINIHMGIAPQYRGSSCNFWALYDNNPHLVGATLHLLSSGLDNGPILRHALPPSDISDGFQLGMASVASAHSALVELIAAGHFDASNAAPQDRTRQIRYTRNADFTDEVADAYLSRLPSPEFLTASLSRRDDRQFLRPFVPPPIMSAA